MKNQHEKNVDLNNIQQNYKIQVKFGDQHKLRFIIKNKKKQILYENVFSLLRLKKLCPIFISCQTIQQACKKLIKKVQQKKFEILEKQRQIFFIVCYHIDDIQHKSNIKLLISNPNVLDIINIKQLVIRPAEPKDVSVILSLIKELALYQKQPESVLVTEKQLLQDLFGKEPPVKFLIFEYNSIPIGYASYLYTYFSWTGKGLYLDDFYVKEEYRGTGIGKNVFAYLSQNAVNNNCDRIQWIVLDWNEPTKQFYNRIGGEEFQGWIIYRMPSKNVRKLASMNHC